MKRQNVRKLKHFGWTVAAANSSMTQQPSLHSPVKKKKGASASSISRAVRRHQAVNFSQPLLHLPDRNLAVVFPRPAEDVAVLGRAERRHLVAVAVQLLQDLVALGVQDVDLSFRGAASDATDPNLKRSHSLSRIKWTVNKSSPIRLSLCFTASTFSNFPVWEQ